MEIKTPSTVSDIIGYPALLEQTAEECVELGHACLKLSRKMRNENYTPRTEEEIIDNLIEEIADVMLCIDELIMGSDKISYEAIESWQISKSDRWFKRLGIKE